LRLVFLARAAARESTPPSPMSFPVMLSFTREVLSDREDKASPNSGPNPKLMFFFELASTPSPIKVRDSNGGLLPRN